MKKSLLVLLIVISNASFGQLSSYLYATFKNKNVYKTKTFLVIKKAYQNNRPATDRREFTIVPNLGMPIINQTITTTTSVPTGIAPLPIVPSTQTTTVVTTTIPPGSTNTLVTVTPSIPPVVGNTTTTFTSAPVITVPPPLATNLFIRYKVISDEGDYKYIRILPGCMFAPNAAGTGNTNIIVRPPWTPAPADDPNDYIFEVAKKDLVPNTHYLASSALIGKVITIPLKGRNEYWNNNNKVLEASLSLGYGFGWKYKLGNNPYHSHYLTTILYAAGISQQKYFSLAGKYSNGTDSLSTKTDQVAITYLAFGLAYEYDKFNIGLFAGKDKMFGNLKDWAYQDRWWFGIGIGYELFK